MTLIPLSRSARRRQPQIVSLQVSGRSTWAAMPPQHKGMLTPRPEWTQSDGTIRSARRCTTVLPLYAVAAAGRTPSAHRVSRGTSPLLGAP